MVAHAFNTKSKSRFSNHYEIMKFQYFGHLMQRADSLEKTLMLGKIEGRKRRGQQRMRCFHGIIDSMDMSLRKLWETVKDIGDPSHRGRKNHMDRSMLCRRR